MYNFLLLPFLVLKDEVSRQFSWKAFDFGSGKAHALLCLEVWRSQVYVTMSVYLKNLFFLQSMRMVKFLVGSKSDFYSSDFNPAVRDCLWGGVESSQAEDESGQKVTLSPEISLIGRDQPLGADSSRQLFLESV